MTKREELEARINYNWSARPVYRGLDVGDGWIDLIDSLITDLDSTGGWPPIVQIKTKFGGLRFYVEGRTTEAQTIMIDKAEAESYKICEECGGPANGVTIGYWLWTLCTSCEQIIRNDYQSRKK